MQLGVHGYSSISAFWDYVVTKKMSSQIHNLWVVVVMLGFSSIWLTRNKLRFEDIKPSLRKSVLHIRSLLRDIGKLSFGHMDNTQSDLLVLHSLGVSAIPKKAPIVSEVCWHPPSPIWLKLNIDGLAKGNPGPAVARGVFRNCRGFVKGIFSFNIGVQSAFYAKILAVILGIEQA
ncbi:hypothetical protein L1049_003330 [Liquidambar formosana]|uniref:Uncharacterized protein n=1 Tax=Liquidambar formosana TaxID=63359 RepID=A0AAP0NJ63_LIQFO